MIAEKGLMRALIETLRNGKVVTAGLDVLPDEPMIARKPNSFARRSAIRTICGIW